MLISLLPDESRGASAKVKQESQLDFLLPHTIPTLNLTVEQLICAENLDETLNEVEDDKTL